MNHGRTQRTRRNPPESPFEKGGQRGISYSSVSVSPCLNFSAGLLVSPRLRSFLPPNYFIQVCGMPQGGIFHRKGRYPGAEG